jgi:NAD(P) transhydrogenase subunit alpha
MLSPLLIALYVAILALFVGRELLTKVPHTLHTPLMSGANAISGITIVGAVTCASFESRTAGIIGMVAVTAAMINVVGGYLVTDRMLKKFHRKD